MADNRHKRLSQISQKNFSIDRFTDLKSNTTSSAGRLTTNHNNTYHHNYAEPHYDVRKQSSDKELEATRNRVSQMEKTMKFWSDCLANWREKWRKVRDERNKAREEARNLSNKLESVTKELCETRRQKTELEAEVKRLESEVKELMVLNNKNNESLSNNSNVTNIEQSLEVLKIRDNLTKTSQRSSNTF